MSVELWQFDLFILNYKRLWVCVCLCVFIVCMHMTARRHLITLCYKRWCYGFWDMIDRRWSRVQFGIWFHRSFYTFFFYMQVSVGLYVSASLMIKSEERVLRIKHLAASTTAELITHKHTHTHKLSSLSWSLNPGGLSMPNTAYEKKLLSFWRKCWKVCIHTFWADTVSIRCSFK